MKKATTLRFLFATVAVTLSDALAGYALFGDARISDHPGAVLLSVILAVAIISTVILGFMSFLSFGAEIVINASGGKFIREKTGSPFHYLLWDELRERIEKE
ncbi:hypothetical protein ACVITL_002604 [Rhizobium pisi]